MGPAERRFRNCLRTKAGDVGMVCLCMLVFFGITRNLALSKML